MRTFVNVDEGVLCELIASATKKLIYMAPGLTKNIAACLARKMQELPSEAVQIILDVDGEVCRLGFGTEEGLVAIQAACKEHQTPLLQQPGLRIGLLIHDDETLVYSPTPLLIEAGSKTVEKPNAILLSQNSGVEKIEETCTGDAHGRKEVGNRIVNEEQLEAVQADLKQNPPKMFDVARIERVFSSKLQYVEFTFEGYRLSSKTVPIPGDLIGLANDNELAARWRNSFKLFSKDHNQIKIEVPAQDEDATRVITEKSLETEKKRIFSEYLFNLPKFGWVLNLSVKEDFQNAVELFKKEVELYQQGVVEKLEKHLESVQKRLVEHLCQGVIDNPPPRLRKRVFEAKISRKCASAFLEEELRKTIRKVDRVFAPDVKLVFKNVAYESFKDPDFMAKLENHLGKQAVDNVMEEYDAARETSSNQPLLSGF